MKKIFEVVIVLLFIVVLVQGCSNTKKSRKIENLEQTIDQYEDQVANGYSNSNPENELQEAKTKIIELEQQISSQVEDDSYINTKFPSDGNYYKEAFDEVTFYADSSCTKKLTNVRFLSPEIDSSQAENGLSIYCLRMDNGEICYCTQSPYLITEEKYKEREVEEEKIEQ